MDKQQTSSFPSPVTGGFMQLTSHGHKVLGFVLERHMLLTAEAQAAPVLPAQTLYVESIGSWECLRLQAPTPTSCFGCHAHISRVQLYQFMLMSCSECPFRGFRYTPVTAE